MVNAHEYFPNTVALFAIYVGRRKGLPKIPTWQ